MSPPERICQCNGPFSWQCTLRVKLLPEEAKEIDERQKKEGFILIADGCKTNPLGEILEERNDCKFLLPETPPPGLKRVANRS